MQDEKLIQALLKGDEKALRMFYNRFSSRLSNFIAQRISDPKDAEEILQDTLIDFLDALRDFTGKSSLYTYLCAIAKFKTIDYYRKKKIKRIVFSKIPQLEYVYSILKTPESELDKKINKNIVREILAQLRPKYCRALDLRYLRGFSVYQVARRMDISFKAAESILFRARREFAFVYEKRFNIQKTAKPA